MEGGSGRDVEGAIGRLTHLSFKRLNESEGCLNPSADTAFFALSARALGF
jgi:hypothetical protein